MPESAEKTTVEGPPRSRRRGRLVTFVLTLAILVLAAPFTSSTVRTGVEVRWLAHRMHSEDQAIRGEARQRLREIGRPAIDAVIPEMFACEVEEKVGDPGPEAQSERVVFVGRALWRHSGLSTGVPAIVTFGYEVADVLPSGSLPTELTLSSSSWLLFPTEFVKNRRELVVMRRSCDDGRLDRAAFRFVRAFPLDDDDLAPAIVDAVRERLAALPPGWSIRSTLR